MQATQSASAESDTDNCLVRHYSVASVDRAEGPGDEDGDWYRYVLVGGRSPITGLRRGTRDEVTEHANRCANDLNQRNNGKSASAWAPRKAKE